MGKKMKKLLTSTALSLILTVPAAFAEPALGLGFSFNFGGGKEISSGLSLRMFSDDSADKFVGTAGLTYFFDDGGYIGLDAGAGYLSSENLGFTIGYDFINSRPQFGVSYVDVC
jgi:hypothetical protein